MISIASITRPALFDLALPLYLADRSRAKGTIKILERLDREAAWTEILKELVREAARTVRKAARWGGILVLKF